MSYFRRCFLAASFAAILTADPLPKIEGETLTGKKIVLPEAASGRPALLIICFTNASRKQSKAWSDRVQQDFGDKLPAYSVVVLQEAPKLVRGMATHGIKSGTPPDRRDRTVLIYNYEKELKLAAGFDRPDDGYLLLLDPKGDVLWKFHGAPTDAAIQELREKLDTDERR